MAPGAVFHGVRKESLAFRLMMKMGWEEGSGLGKDKQGIKRHLVVKKKDDNAGVGANETHNWTFNTTAFDNLLKNLRVQVGDKRQETKQEDDVSDSESEKTSKDESKEDEESASKAQVEVKKVSRPQGRYKRMQRGKMVQNYSKEDLHSILGSVVEKDIEVPQPEVKQVSAKHSVESTAGSNPPANWWGNKFGFVKGGTLGTSSNCTSKNTHFSENDQEMLYKSVHDKAAKGRGGLGVAGRSGKIGGAHWKGQKIAFDDAEDVQMPPNNSNIAIETKKKREPNDETENSSLERKSSSKKQKRRKFDRHQACMT